MVKLVSIKKIFLFVQYFPKVIEYSLPPPEEPQLIDLTVRQFVASVPISSRIFFSSTDPPPLPLTNLLTTSPNNVKRCTSLRWEQGRRLLAEVPCPPCSRPLALDLAQWWHIFEIIVKFVFF